MTVERKRDILINILYIAVIAVLGFLIFSYLFLYMTPFVIGIIVAIALQRPVDWLTKHTKFPRSVWSISLVILTLCLLLGIVGFALSRLYSELWDFVKTLPSYIPELTRIFDGINTRLVDMVKDLPPELISAIVALPSNLASSVTGALTSTLSGIANNVATGLPGILISSIVTVVACCFITKDYYKISEFIKRQLSPKHWNLLMESKGLFVRNILKMLRGYALLMFITFCELAIGLTLFGYDYAVVLALLISFIDILPVLGTGTILIPWGFVLIISGNFWGGIGILILYGVITIVRNTLEPRIIGRQVGLPSLVVLVAMYAGLKMFGLIGIFGFPVIIIILKNLQDSGKIRIWK